MRFAVSLLLFLIPISGMAEVYRCGEPKGVALWSNEAHKISPDGFTGVEPVVIVEEKKMTIVWGDSKTAGGSEKVWKAAVFHHSSETVSGIALDEGPSGSASMLFTVDIKRGFLYMSSHKEHKLLNTSAVSTYVSKCTK